MEVFTQLEPLPNSIYMELITKGEHIGLKKGERQAKLNDAYNLYKLGVPMDTIVKATSLSEEQIWEYIRDREKKKKIRTNKIKFYGGSLYIFCI